MWNHSGHGHKPTPFQEGDPDPTALGRRGKIVPREEPVVWEMLQPLGKYSLSSCLLFCPPPLSESRPILCPHGSPWPGWAVSDTPSLQPQGLVGRAGHVGMWPRPSPTESQPLLARSPKARSRGTAHTKDSTSDYRQRHSGAAPTPTLSPDSLREKGDP